MEAMMGHKLLALAVMQQAYNDRESAIRLSAMSRQEILDARIERALASLAQKRKTEITLIDRARVARQCEKALDLDLREARETKRTVREFLCNDSIWHQILDIHPDTIRARWAA